MIGLSINESTRAAALDGGLSFSVLLQNQRELTVGTAQSSVTGLLSAIQSAPADYARLLEVAEDAVNTQYNAASKLGLPAWSDASPATRDVIRDALTVAIAATKAAEKSVSPALAAAAEEIPTTFQLNTDTPPATYLTTWGDSGAISLTDANGRGVFITHDGKVDTLPASGAGWQFQTESTFLLPDGTKISVSPGTPASLLATRGQQRIEITNLQPGQTPSATYFANGGLAADAARNDGHIFTMGVDQGSWTLSGAPLGDVDGSREIVATTPVDNEFPVDVTNVTLPPDLVAQLQNLGVAATAFDANGDGRFSNLELQKLVAALDAAIGGAQSRFDSALARTTAALGSLQRLNQFLEKILAESDRRQASHQQAAAEERDQLLQIQRDLDAARNALRNSDLPSPATPGDPNVLAAARQVLNQIETLGSKSAKESSSLSSAVPSGDHVAASPTQPVSDAPTAALTQAFRRAERLLSAQGGPAAPRFAEPLPARPTRAIPEGNGSQSSNATDAFSAVSSGVGGPAVPVEIPRAPLPITFAAPFSDVSTPSDPNAPVSLSPLPPDSSVPPQTTQIPTPLPPVISAPIALAPEDAPIPVSPPRSASPFIPASALTPDGKTLRAPEFAANDETRRPQIVQPRTPSGQSILPGTSFPPTGSEWNVAPDPTFGASDGFTREFRRRLDQHLGTHREHIGRAQQIQSSVRQTVERFLTIVSQDEQLRQVFSADDLSDAQRDAFKGKVDGLEREFGLTWGGEAKKTPQGEANLNARVLNSGMMI